MSRAPVLLALALAVSLPAVVRSSKTDGQIRSKRSDLREVERELDRKRTEKAAAERKEKELSEEVDRISGELRASRRALKEVQGRVRDAERRRKAAEERVWASRLEMGQWSDVLSKELRIFYERRAALGAAAAVELAYRRAALNEKVQSLSFARQHHAQVEGLRDELLAAEVDLQKLRLNREHEERRVESAQERMRGLYKTAQGRKSVLSGEIRDLQATARELGNLLETLIEQRRKEEAARAAAAAAAGKPAAKSAPTAANRRRGKLPWPTQGSVVDRYGRSRHPELDTYVFSNGIKLQPAAAGAVRAVDKGEVVYAGEFMSYGLMVLVQHSDNLHSVYAHLGQINVARGQTVSVGESLGSSGQDDRGKPLVYFELRVGGVAVDPLLWLQ